MAYGRNFNQRKYEQRVQRSLKEAGVLVSTLALLLHGRGSFGLEVRVQGGWSYVARWYVILKGVAKGCFECLW